jgi:hypothetical protein
MNTTRRHEKSALDQFLPERMFAADARRSGGATHIDAADVTIEPIEMHKEIAPATATPSTQVQPWPMLAAALVAIGFSLLAFAAFARFGLP